MAKFDPALFEDVHGPMIEARTKELKDLFQRRQDAAEVVKSYVEQIDGVWAFFVYNPKTNEYRWAIESHPAKLRIPSKPHRSMSYCLEDFRLVLNLFETDWMKVLNISNPEKLQIIEVDWNKIPSVFCENN